ncbi:MAG TPA: S9 family peptidase [Gammaproteobacteria bacterium]|nr:S9 family peptidase [Gammaproteobacteria bacterium]
MRHPAACGSWVSPLGAARIAAGNLRLMQPRTAGDYVYWVESRPAENGRGVLVRNWPGGSRQDLTPPPFSVRSRVHEYGGGAYTISNESVFFVNDSDQQIYHLPVAGGAPHQLTTAHNCRFADLLPDERRRRLVCVCEDHTEESAQPVNSLVSVALRDGALTTLVRGYDFYSSPAMHPGGGQLAWLGWNYPHMPWDVCELWLAELDAAGAVQNPRCLAGGADESIFQPQFAPDGGLYFISDRDGFWNIYKYADGKIHAVTHDHMDYGFPLWLFGMSSYGFMPDGGLCATRLRQGCSELVRIGAGGKTEKLAGNFSQIEHLHTLGNRLVLLAGDPTHAPAVILVEAGDAIVLSQNENWVPAEFLSTPEAIIYPTTDGETANAWYYPPRNPDFCVSATEKPLLLVKCHGGPTAMNGNGLDPRIQFWTSRGFAVADVNYRGSSGYGRAYRRSLHGQWGIKDVEDCVHAARHLVNTGRVDGERLIISGSSAGGFTVLCALAFHDFFKAGAVYYGISELTSAMTDTHKFEAHYGNSLLGPWPAARELYRARSPLYAADNINCPVIFFQGLKDRVVPPDQAQRMVQALRAKKLPVAYVTFAAEGHGFRRSQSIQRALEAELAFYARIFGFMPAACV